VTASLSLFDLVPQDEPQAAATIGGESPVPPRVLAALRRADVTCLNGAAMLDLPPIDADVYAAAKPILAECGFTWSSKRRTHLGNADAAAIFERVLATERYYDSKHALEFFATSAAGANILARLAAAELFMDEPRILEPSAGDGALIDALLAAVPHARITGVELDVRRADALVAEYRNDPRVRIVRGDILAFDENGYDGAVMNPPFAFALEHVRHVAGLLDRRRHVFGIASTTRPRDRELALWLHDHDAWTSPTDRDTFVDTTVRAAFFGFRSGTTMLDELRAALLPHPAIAETHIRTLADISRDLHVLAEAYCNGDVPDFDERVASLMRRAVALVGHEGIGVIHASDPRAGHGIKLIMPSGKTNDFADTGIIVPPSLRCAAPLTAIRAYASRTA
jgi:predicted RNA methylase